MNKTNDLGDGELAESVGPYRLMGRLGRGGMGVVYRAYDERLKRQLAIKRILLRGSERKRTRQRFRREAQAAASLNHPSIVQIYDLVETDEGSWIAMELVEGETLQAMIRREPVSVFQALVLGRQVAEGLAEAHRMGIVHRDLKTENVMITDSGQAKILDFGLAKRPEADQDGGLSRQGAVLGTYRSMSPEQALGQSVDFRSDLFSFGTLLYEMLSGLSPFQTGNSVETLARICSYRQPSLDKVVQGIPAELARLVDCLLEKDRQLRPQGALAVAASLASLADSRGYRDPRASGAEALSPAMQETVLTQGMDLEGLGAVAREGAAGSSAKDSVALTTLLLSDLVNSTRLVERLGDSEAAALFQRHDRIARDLLIRFGGREIDKTDGFLLLFKRPIHAVLYAQAYHRSLGEVACPEELELRARVGIHLGEVVLHENSAADVARGAKPLEIEGLAKPVVSRLMSLASGRQTLIGRGVYDMARRGVVGEELEFGELSWVFHGGYLFAGVEEPVEVFEVGEPGLAPLSAPGDSTQATRVSEASLTSSGTFARALVRGRQKPARRMGWLLLVSLLLAAVLLVSWAWRRSLPLLEPVYVAVLEPKISTTDDLSSLGLVASGIRSALMRGLMTLEGVAPLSIEQVDAVNGSPQTVARALAAGEILSVRLDCVATSCQVQLGRSRGETGESLGVEVFNVPIDDLLLMSTSVESRVRRIFSDHGSRDGSVDWQVEKADYEGYLRLRQDLRRRGAAPLDQLATEAQAIAISSPDFFEIHLLSADIDQQRFLHSQDPAFLRRAFASLERAEELWPGNPLPLFSRFDLALDGQRLPEAEAALAALRELEPGNARVLAQEALLLERKGQAREALDTMRLAAERWPSWPNLMDLSNMEYRQGEFQAARDHLGFLLARNPGFFNAQALLAQVELLYGDPQSAVGLYEELVRRSPTMGYLMNLGLSQFLVESYEAAAASFRSALDLAPSSPYAALNLADSELLAGRREEALELYGLVERILGPEVEQWQQLTVRAQALAHLGRRKEAVEAVQKALRVASENPQAKLEAAIVYALAGESTSCLVNAEQALAQGVEERWFGLPWFDALRSDPEFRSLFEDSGEL